jgi:hypothetical protein
MLLGAFWYWALWKLNLFFQIGLRRRVRPPKKTIDVPQRIGSNPVILVFFESRKYNNPRLRENPVRGK